MTDEVRKQGERLYGPPDQLGAGLAMCTDEQLEFLTEFMRRNIAFQEEKMALLEDLKAREAEAQR